MRRFRDLTHLAAGDGNPLTQRAAPALSPPPFDKSASTRFVESAGFERTTLRMRACGPLTACAVRMAANSDHADAMLGLLLLRHAVQGDEQAFVALASMHCEEVYQTARNLSASDVEALELTQGAFQAAWNQISAMPADLSFRAFVLRFAVKDAVERLRRANPSAFTVIDRSLPATGGKRSAHLWQVVSDVEQLNQRPDIAERLNDALALLDPQDRAAFVLRVIDEVSIDDAAAILELPVSIVQRRTHRACLLVSGYLSNLVVHP
jgi:RNA polymerase sigma-70 factor, ECF subfamily